MHCNTQINTVASTMERWHVVVRGMRFEVQQRSGGEPLVGHIVFASIRFARLVFQIVCAAESRDDNGNPHIFRFRVADGDKVLTLDAMMAYQLQFFQSHFACASNVTVVKVALKTLRFSPGQSLRCFELLDGAPDSDTFAKGKAFTIYPSKIPATRRRRQKQKVLLIIYLKLAIVCCRPWQTCLQRRQEKPPWKKF